MEVAAAGTVDEARVGALLQLLAGLAGHVPDPIHIHEIVMRLEGAGRDDIHLRRLSTPGTAATAHR